MCTPTVKTVVVSKWWSCQHGGCLSLPCLFAVFVTTTEEPFAPEMCEGYRNAMATKTYRVSIGPGALFCEIMSTIVNCVTGSIPTQEFIPTGPPRSHEVTLGFLPVGVVAVAVLR